VVVCCSPPLEVVTVPPPVTTNTGGAATCIAMLALFLPCSQWSLCCCYSCWSSSLKNKVQAETETWRQNSVKT
jgi:hypothetical protein